MRAAIAAEKGDADPWDLKYAAGGLVDIEFVAQYLQLVHAAALPEILDTSTARVLEKAARARRARGRGRRSAAPGGAALSRPCADFAAVPPRPVRSQIGRAPACSRLLARAADLPDFPALEAHVKETQQKVRECFVRILGGAP